MKIHKPRHRNSMHHYTVRVVYEEMPYTLLVRVWERGKKLSFETEYHEGMKRRWKEPAVPDELREAAEERVREIILSQQAEEKYNLLKDGVISTLKDQLSDHVRLHDRSKGDNKASDFEWYIAVEKARQSLEAYDNLKLRKC